MGWARSVCRVWPFGQIADWVEWHRKDRQETVVATCVYTTAVVAGSDTDLKPTGLSHAHILTLLVDGHGVRYSHTSTTSEVFSKSHTALLKAESNWRHHGEVPEHGRRVGGQPRGKLIAFPGGAA